MIKTTQLPSGRFPSDKGHAWATIAHKNRLPPNFRLARIKNLGLFSLFFTMVGYNLADGLRNRQLMGL
ncbi:MAG: hypothetical protein CTY16_02780 [Methylobacter sp.]|nr:MAG: hypothetical protein CTY16_02780 [Methylobacter sp.]